MPLLSPQRKESNEKCCGISGKGLEAFRNQAVSQFQINIPFELKEENFNSVEQT